MNVQTIPIPGGSTRFDDAPIVEIQAGRNQPLSLVVRYVAGQHQAGQPALLGEITFKDVLEYRWIESEVEYEDFTEHEDAYEFGLIQIQESRYIERMAAKGPWRDFPQQRFGGTIHEEDIKHFRLAFDEYGRFDVIALGVVIREINSLTS